MFFYKTDVFQAFCQAIVIRPAQVAIELLLRFGSQITAQPAEMGAVGIAHFVGMGMVQAMGNDVAFLAKANGIGPEKEARPPTVAEFEGAVGTIAVIPDRVVNGGNHGGDAHDSQDADDGKIPGHEQNKDRKSSQVIGKIQRGQKREESRKKFTASTHSTHISLKVGRRGMDSTCP